MAYAQAAGRGDQRSCLVVMLAQLDDSNWMGTLMVWASVQVARPGRACQIVSLVRCTARALIAPWGPAASVAVPGGRTGSFRHGWPGPVIVSLWSLVSTTAAVPSAPNDAEVRAAPWSGNGGESVQCAQLSADQAVTKLAAEPLPAPSSATVCCAVRVSLSTVMSCRARGAGIAGGAGPPGAGAACGGTPPPGGGASAPARGGARGGGDLCLVLV